MNLGRNELCHCGSGKKFKKCCGTSKVVPLFQEVQNFELSSLQDELLNYGMRKYTKELDHILTDTLDKLKIDLDNVDATPELRDIFLFMIHSWIMFCSPVKKGQTIVQDFIQFKLKSPIRTAMKTMLESWEDVQPSIYRLSSYQSDKVAFVRNIFNQEERQVYLTDEEDLLPEEGDLLIGLITAAGSYDQFFVTYLTIPQDRAHAYLDTIDLHGYDPQKFPEFISKALNPSKLLFDNRTLNWENAQYELIAHRLEAELKKRAFPAHEISLAIRFWHIYCQKVSPVIRKPEVYLAAMEYLVGYAVTLGDGYQSQASIAEKHKVSVSSLSARFRHIEEIIAKELDDLDPISDEDEKEEASFSKMEMEQTLWDIQKLIEGKDFNSLEEVNEYIGAHINQTKPRPKPTSMSSREKAQELIYEAWDAPGKRRYELAKQALDLNPNHPDGYVILAERSTSAAEEKKLLTQAVRAGEKQLGQAFFKQNKGHFWGLIETRPYMRAKQAYAFYLWEIGEHHEAIQQFSDLLELNPNDNQGIRYHLLNAYIELGLYSEARALIKQYVDDGTANFLYNKVILDYLSTGVTTQTYALIKAAKKQNPHVVEFLLRKKKLPRKQPEYIGFGDEREAIAYCQEQGKLWWQEPKLLEALKR